jgi:two-component system cell cycle response regulator DivK
MPALILIAEDYEDNRELLRLMLERAGHRVSEARDGRECLTLARLELPDLCLLDLSMPVLDGFGVLKELRADERTRAIPCVAITAFADAQRERAIQSGFDAYLSKPFRSIELTSTVERLLARTGASVSLSDADAEEKRTV